MPNLGWENECFNFLLFIGLKLFPGKFNTVKDLFEFIDFIGFIYVELFDFVNFFGGILFNLLFLL